MACEHQMNIVSVGEHYFWGPDDIYNLEVREVWECDKCGEVVSCPVVANVEDEVLNNSMYL